MGVRRAYEYACAEVKRSAGKVYTLGPLIHNPRALAELKQKGVEILDEAQLPDDLGGTVVIIRAHGVCPQTEAELHKRGAAVVDATCPRVKASQLKAAALAKAGYRIFLAGEESHTEIIGILGYAQAAACGATVVSNADEAEKAAAQLHAEGTAFQNKVKTALIGQTTISPEEYHAIGKAITHFFPNLEITQTICAATGERQDSLRELLGKTDAVIIAGGKESSNTRRLYSIAQESGKPCALVETAADIPPEFYQFKKIGLAAGASTPDTVIDEIENSIKFPHSTELIPKL